jgi:hypothetical protein
MRKREALLSGMPEENYNAPGKPVMHGIGIGLKFDVKHARAA